MTIKSDIWIRKMAEEKGMISPFEPKMIREIDGQKIVSYGTSSYGYDIRCAPEFRVFTNINNTVVDPKSFDPNSFVEFNDEYCIIAEDDISFEYTKYWNNTFWEWLVDLPDDWECVQLSQILTIQSMQSNNYLLDRIKVLSYESNFSWSTTAYMLNRKGAQKLLETVKIFDNKYYFKNLRESIADVYIYKHLNTFTIPLFTYMMNNDSTINNNDKHLEISKKSIDKIWINYYESNN